MYKLYHHSVCPTSRMIRFVLNELGIEYILYEEKYWEYDRKFLQINPMGSVPVLIIGNGTVLNHAQLILEYLHTNYNELILFPDENDRLNVKKVAIWFYEKLFYDCTKYFIQEKFITSLQENAQPNANILSLARYNLSIHFEYLEYLLDQNTWLAGEKFSFADISAASQFSVLDYFGEIRWSKIPRIKDWYCIIKSRPSFRSFLRERITGIIPPKHYLELDF